MILISSQASVISVGVYSVPRLLEGWGACGSPPSAGVRPTEVRASELRLELGYLGPRASLQELAV